MWGPKNWWQVAGVIGIAIGACLSMRSSGARRPSISPGWAQAIGTTTFGARAHIAFLAGFIMHLRRPHRRWLYIRAWHLGHGTVGSTFAVAAMFTGGILTAPQLKRA